MIRFFIYYYFIVVALFLTIRLLVFKRKKTTISRIILETVFLVYVTAIIDVTIFPIDYYTTVKGNINLVPFGSIIEISSHLSHTYYTPVIKQILGNLFLLTPFGFLFPFISKKANSLSRVVFYGFIFTIGIEIIQVLISVSVGNGYRSFDIDDIILNLLGTMIGYIIYKWTQRFLVKKFTLNFDNH